MHDSVTMDHDLLKYLRPSGVDEEELSRKIIPQLIGKGFKKVGDLEDLEESDLNGKLIQLLFISYVYHNKGFDDLTKRRIWRLVHSVNRPSNFSVNSDVFQEDQEYIIYVRYVLCSGDLFSDDIMQTEIKDIDPTTMTLLHINKRILEDAKIPPEQTIELYSSEGYPLHNNEITNKGNTNKCYYC